MNYPRYKDKSVRQLLKIATKHFNEYVRLRDAPDGTGNCISCGRFLTVPSANAHAGHFYPGGNYPALKFDEDNCSLQCRSCNYYKSGNLHEYRKNLIEKIGAANVTQLDKTAELSKAIRFKWNRFHLIEIIEEYKTKKKLLKQ